jgi:hypothetical protein
LAELLVSCDDSEVGSVLAAIETTVSAGTAAVTVSQHRGTLTGPMCGIAFSGVMDLAGCCGGGIESSSGWLGRRIRGDRQVWWEPDGPATLIGETWMNFAHVPPLPDMPAQLDHPLFLLRAIPKWLTTDAEPDVVAGRDVELTLDLGGAMLPSGEVVDAVRFVRACVRVDGHGRCVELSHTLADHAGHRLNPWRRTRLSEFGCPAPSKPAGIPESVPMDEALGRWRSTADRITDRIKRDLRGSRTAPPIRRATYGR